MSTLVYDGDCGICAASADWVRKRVSAVHVESHHQHQFQSLEKVLLLDGSGRLEGADAVSEVLKRADSRRWRTVGHALGLPVAIHVARGVYAVVARNRTRLSAALGLNACAREDDHALR